MSCPAGSRIHLPLLLILAALAFVGLGLSDGLLGVAWPSVRATFGLSHDALGPLLVVFTAGGLLSGAGGGPLVARLGAGRLISLGALALAAGLLGAAVAPLWPFMVGSSFLAGLGAGAIDAGVNTYAADRHGPRALNWLHAAWGIGVSAGPILMISLIAAGASWRGGYALVGAALTVLGFAILFTKGRWRTLGGDRPAPSDIEPGAHAAPRASARQTLRLPRAWLGIAFFFVYTGLEAAAGQWAFSLFTEARGVSAPTAGLWVSLYWASLTAGRLLFGAIAGLAPLRLLLRGCLIAAVLGTALLALGGLPPPGGAPVLSFLGLALAGLALAPLYPSLVAGTPARMSHAHAANAVGFQVASAALGAAVLPGAIGLLASASSLEVVGPALLGGAVLLLALYEALTFSAPPAG
jgi:fucose permease